MWLKTVARCLSVRQTTVISKPFLLGPGFTCLHKFLTFLRSPTYKGIFQNVAKITIINRLETGRPLEIKFFFPPHQYFAFWFETWIFWWDFGYFWTVYPYYKIKKASVKIGRSGALRSFNRCTLPIHTPICVSQCFIVTDQIWRERMLCVPHYGPWLFSLAFNKSGNNILFGEKFKSNEELAPFCCLRAILKVVRMSFVYNLWPLI